MLSAKNGKVIRPWFLPSESEIIRNPFSEVAPSHVVKHEQNAAFL